MPTTELPTLDVDAIPTSAKVLSETDTITEGEQEALSKEPTVQTTEKATEEKENNYTEGLIAEPSQIREVIVEPPEVRVMSLMTMNIIFHS